MNHKLWFISIINTSNPANFTILCTTSYFDGDNWEVSSTLERCHCNRFVRNILSLIFVEFGLFWMFWLYLSYYEGIGMRQLGLPPKNAPNCVVMESKSEEEESGGVSPPHQVSYMTLKSSTVTTPREDFSFFSVFTFKKNCQNSTGPKCQLSWLSDSWDIYIRL